MQPGAAVMARPKKKAAEPTPTPPERVAIIHLKGTLAYSEWLEAAHRKTRLPKATIFRLAVEEWAARNGIVPPPGL